MLREELDRPDGLADPSVYVLDPCCGTGAYSSRCCGPSPPRCATRARKRLFGDKLKTAATKRVFGFEILPAPFVVAHLQLGLFLQAEGAPLAEGKNGTRRRLPDQRPDRLGAAQGAETGVSLSGNGGGTRRGRAR